MACAWEAARRGLRPCVLDAGEPGAWQVAAGMLAPVAESDFGEGALTALGIRAAEGFEAYCAELAEATGEDPGFRATGTLIVARDRDDAEVLERLLAFRQSAGLPVERLRPSQARRAEAALAPTVRLALDVPGDHSADPRKLVRALGTAVERAGGEVRHGARVVELLTEDGRAKGVRLATAVWCVWGGWSWRPARGRRNWRVSPTRYPCDPSKGRSCDCTTRAGRASSSARSARRRAATWSRAGTAATSSAPRSRSAASRPRRPPAASSSSCATCPG